MIRWVLFLLVVPIVCAVIYWSQSDGRTMLGSRPSEANPASEKPPEIPRKIFAAGIVEGLDAPLRLRFESVGRVTGVYVSPGDSVEAQQVLAELDPTVHELRYVQAEAQLQIARVERDRLKRARRGRNDAPSSTRPTQAEASRSMSESSNSSTSTSTSINDELVIADARVKVAEAALKLERVELGKRRLLAPQAGIILAVSLQPGTMVGAVGEDDLVTMVNRTKTRVRAFVEELDAFDVMVGQSALVVASGVTDREFLGYVTECAPYVQPKMHRHTNPGERLDVRVREVTIDLHEADSLLIGLPVEVFIDRTRGERIQRLPNSSPSATETSL